MRTPSNDSTTDSRELIPPPITMTTYMYTQDKGGLEVGYETRVGARGEEWVVGNYHALDVFGNEEGHQIRYKTLSWQFVAVLMIAEIVSNGMLSLPSSLATVGIVPGVILILVLGAFATYTSWLLVKFKLRHPEVHSMGDAGYILFGPIGREILSIGTVIFAIFATGSQLLAGQIALTALTDNRLCSVTFTGIFAAVTTVISAARTLDSLSWISVPAVISILLAAFVGMIGAGADPTEPRHMDIALHPDFYTAFLSITNPVFAYAGHFMFFFLFSEMKRPQDGMKAAWTLQSVATTIYILFAVVSYAYLGPTVASPSLLSLTPKWRKASFGIALPNFIVAGSLYAHTASKLFFVRFFRGQTNSRHLYSHTFKGWATWIALILICNGAAFVLAVGVPIFNYLLGLAASLFAAWYTYGIAGGFYLYDTYQDQGGKKGLVRNWRQTALAILTIILGAFICIAGTWACIKGIHEAYRAGNIQRAFDCSASN